jgi:1,2-diacylglycerol 3-beta-glucosyltransferase
MIRMLLIRLSLALGSWGSASTAYLLGLLLAAAVLEAEPESDGPPEALVPHLMILVPAHDEEPVVGKTVEALLRADYPPERRRVIVIADNCGDATSAVALAAGAEVWERAQPDRAGKGHAIAWALRRAALESHDAVVMVDADCVASPNLLLGLARSIAAGADAVQARYLASNPTVAPAAALRYAGFALVNSVRPLAKSKLGLSAGLLGSGMAFPARTLTRVPWDAFSVTEDREYHLQLIHEGLTVRYVKDASVSSAMPTTASAGTAQQMRWDTGNVRLAHRYLGKLLARGLETKSGDAIHAALELLVPPQTLLAVTGLSALATGLVLRAPAPRRLGWFVLVGQAAYVVGGLRLIDAPPAAYQALPRAPGLIARRVVQHALILSGRGSRAWVRTDRMRD